MDTKQCRKLFMLRLKNTLRAFRAKLGISQEKMADKLHITPRAYANLEGGSTGFSAWTLLMLIVMLPDEEILALVLGLREDVKASDNAAA